MSEPSDGHDALARPCLCVHWSGYVQDPGPTAKARAAGKAVCVEGDAPWLMANSIRLAPTDYPIPAPWGARMAKIGRDPSACGAQGCRMLANGHVAMVVGEDVWTAAVAAGFTQRDGSTWGALTKGLSGGERVSLGAASETRDRYTLDRVSLGGTLIQRVYLDLLIALGVEAVTVYGPRDPVVAEGVAIVMPIPDEAVTT